MCRGCFSQNSPLLYSELQICGALQLAVEGGVGFHCCAIHLDQVSAFCELGGKSYSLQLRIAVVMHFVALWTCHSGPIQCSVLATRSGKTISTACWYYFRNPKSSIVGSYAVSFILIRVVTPLCSSQMLERCSLMFIVGKHYPLV